MKSVDHSAVYVQSDGDVRSAYGFSVGLVHYLDIQRSMVYLHRLKRAGYLEGIGRRPEVVEIPASALSFFVGGSLVYLFHYPVYRIVRYRLHTPLVQDGVYLSRYLRHARFLGGEVSVKHDLVYNSFALLADSGLSSASSPVVFRHKSQNAVSALHVGVDPIVERLYRYSVLFCSFLHIFSASVRQKRFYYFKPSQSRFVKSVVYAFRRRRSVLLAVFGIVEVGEVKDFETSFGIFANEPVQSVKVLDDVGFSFMIDRFAGSQFTHRLSLFSIRERVPFANPFSAFPGPKVRIRAKYQILSP